MLIWLFIIGNIFILVGLFIWGHTPQVYKEYVIGSVAFTGTNKSLELNLFWIVLFAGIVSIVLFYTRCADIVEYSAQLNKPDNNILVMCVMIAGFYAYKGSVPSVLLFTLVVSVFFKILCEEDYDKAIIMYMLLFFGMIAIIYFLCEHEVNITGCLILSLFVCILSYSLVCKENFYRRALLICQCFFPFFLLVYIKNNYEYDGKEVLIERGIAQNAFWVMVIFLLLAGNVYHLFKYWNFKGAELKDIISIFTCISVAGLCTFQGIAYKLIDGHHQGELVLAFQQLKEYHQIPYVDYYPVSGLFPVVLGGFMEIFCGGGLTGSDAIVAIYSFLISSAVVVLGSRFVNKKYLLLIAFIIPMANGYVRTNLLLPYILILLLPELIANKGAWILVWIALSYLEGFYYPLYGMASVLGILPLALLQIREYIEEKEYKTDIRKPWFVAFALLEAVILVLSLPSLSGAIRHTLIYASGSRLSNSISVFGTSVPENFMSWLNECEWLRRCIWYTFRYSIPAWFIWVCVLLALKALKRNKLREIVKYSKVFNISVYAGIVLAVSCTLTLMRIDQSSFLARSLWVFVPMAGVLLAIVLISYIEHSAASMALLAIVFLLITLTTGNCVTALDSKLTKSIQIEKDCVYVSKEESNKYENLGEGFLPEEVYQNLERYFYISSKLLEIDPDLCFWGLDLNYIYILNLKTCGQPSVFAIASYRDAQMELESLEREKPVIFADTLSAVSGYYLYKWLMQTDLYIYNDEFDVYLPAEVAAKAGIVSSDKRTGYAPVTNIGRLPGSFGKSFESLSGDFERTKVNVNIEQGQLISSEDGSSSCWIGVFPEQKIVGTDADFLYLELSRENNNVSSLESIEDHMLKKVSSEEINPDCTVVISWEGEAENTADNFISCKMEDGKLLIPLGANVNWLLNNHDAFHVVVYGLDKEEYAKIDTCVLLKSKSITEREDKGDSENG